MAIADQIAELTTIRGDIRTALAGKGVSATDHDYADFATDISSIPSGGGTDNQVFPFDMAEHILPTMALTYNGEAI